MDAVQVLTVDPNPGLGAPANNINNPAARELPSLPLSQMNVQFINNLSSNDAVSAHTHDHGNGSHTHGGPGDHGHTHEILEHPGNKFEM